MNRTEQNRTEQNRTEQNRTEQNRTEQNRTEHVPLLGKDESSAIKGLLIFLIVLGHNRLLLPTGGPLQRYLYMFHISAFFILPFFYSIRSYHWKDYCKLIVNCYIPYTVFFIIAIFSYRLLKAEAPFSWQQACMAFIYPEQWRLKIVTGYHFLWFLPAFCTMMLIKHWFDTNGKIIKGVILGICLLTFFPQMDAWMSFIPFDFYIALTYFRIAILTLLFWKGVMLCTQNTRTSGILAGCSFLVLTAVFWGCSEPIRSSLVFRLLFPVFFFCILLWVKDLLRNSKFLKSAGTHSLFIYLTHVFVVNIFLLVLPKSFYEGNRFFTLGIGIFILLLTFGIVYAGSIICSRIPLLDFFFAPAKYIPYFQHAKK